jgi:hypothetical protein
MKPLSTFFVIALIPIVQVSAQEDPNRPPKPYVLDGECCNNTRRPNGSYYVHRLYDYCEPVTILSWCKDPPNSVTFPCQWEEWETPIFCVLEPDPENEEEEDPEENGYKVCKETKRDAEWYYYRLPDCDVILTDGDHGQLKDCKCGPKPAMETDHGVGGADPNNPSEDRTVTVATCTGTCETDPPFDPNAE